MKFLGNKGEQIKKDRVTNCLNEMHIHWDYEEATSADCCHGTLELLEQKLCKEGSVLVITPYYTSKLLPLVASCNRPLESIMTKHWSKWVMDR